MKKIMKFVLGFVVVIFIIIAVFWGSFVYVSDYKITKADTSVSPDGTYELVLQAVGEADFPFGSASGRLVLYEGKSRISKADFELFDDGGSIRSSVWEVTWHEDSVEVILSGDEQFDEQIILYFNGKKERKQLTDKEEYTESGDINEIEEITSQSAYESEPENQEEINPQTAYTGELERQEDMEPNENDTRLDDNKNSMEYINKYMIPEQSFDVTLDDWGKVKFVSCKPTYDIDPQEYAAFFLIRDEQILYRFPYRYENNTIGSSGMFDNVGTVAFRDVNNDGKKDIIIICYYFSGAGPTGMVPRPDIRIFIAEENDFYLAEDMVTDIEQHILEKDMTIETVCNYLKNNN